jgi:hypothetical protein
MRTDEFISRLGPKADPKRNGNGWMVRCPAHDDRNGSLSVGEGRDGRILLHCHAGCKVEAICEAKGIALADLMPAGGRKVKRCIVAIYDYTDEDGKLLFQKVRYDPKYFNQRRPDPTGKDGWIWNKEGVRSVLYRLPELVSEVFAEREIYVAEGEKDADALRAHGFAATCNPEGASESKNKPKWLDSYSESLRGASVVIIADKDRSGRTHAGAVARLLQGFANSVKVLELPDVDDKPVKDAADYFAAGGEAMDLQELAHAAPFWTPKTQVETVSSSTPEPQLAESASCRPDAPRRSALPRELTIRTPSELLGMAFDDSDIILGDRLMAKGQPFVLAGAGGTGKTRLAFQLAACVATERKFLIFQTHNPELRWLFLQTENSNRTCGTSGIGSETIGRGSRNKVTTQVKSDVNRAGYAGRK